MKESEITHRTIASCAVDTPWSNIEETALQRFLALSPEERGRAWAECIRNAKSQSTGAAQAPASSLPVQTATPFLRVVAMPVQPPPAPPVLTSTVLESVIRIPSDREVKYPPWALPMHEDLDKKGPAIFNPAGLNQWLHPDQKQGSPVKAQVVYGYLMGNARSVGAHLIEGCLGLRELDAIKDRGLQYYLEYFPNTRVLGWRSVARSKAREKADEELLRERGEGLPDLTKIKRNIAGLLSRVVPPSNLPVAGDALENLWVPYLEVIARVLKISWLRLDHNIGSNEPTLLFK